LDGRPFRPAPPGGPGAAAHRERARTIVSRAASATGRSRHARPWRRALRQILRRQVLREVLPGIQALPGIWSRTPPS